MTISSPDVAEGATLPDQYTCAGKDFPYSGMPPVDHLSPALSWTAGPEGTLSYAIVFTDVTLTTGEMINELGYHWAIYDIPTSVTSLPQGLPSGNPVTAVPGATQYSGALFNSGYVGPCPSWGVAPGSPLLGMDPPPMASLDTYTFTVYAMPFANATAPAMRPPPAEGEPAVVYVRDLDEYFLANSIGLAKLTVTSSAAPANFATPPM